MSGHPLAPYAAIHEMPRTPQSKYPFSMLELVNRSQGTSAVEPSRRRAMLFEMRVGELDGRIAGLVP